MLKSRFKIGDMVIFLLVLGIVASLSYRIYFQDSDSRHAVVSVSHEVVRVLSENELMGKEIYTIPLEKGNAEIEVDGGKLRVLPMNRELCPKGICSSMGWIKRNGSSIICVPNRLIVQLAADTGRGRIDAIAR